VRPNAMAMETSPPLLDHREPPPRARLPRHPLLPWYAGLLAGILPVLILGFLYSALADRLEFVGWALLLAAFYTVALRQGLQAGWPPARLAGALMMLLAAGAGAFAWLERTHHEVLDLGYRAALPEQLYFPAATSPRAAVATAAILAATGAAVLAGGLIARRRP
jgi:hypothetical protein